MRRSTAIYIVILAILAGFYYYLNNRPQAGETDSETPESTSAAIEYLFSFEDDLPTRIHIESKAGDVVEVARDAENVWALTLPFKAPADQGPVEAAVGQISTIRVLDRVPNLPKDAVGLDDPEFIITIQFTSNMERIIEVGVLTPTESGYYTNQRGDNKILIASNSALDALIGLLTNPPYLATTETPPP